MAILAAAAAMGPDLGINSSNSSGGGHDPYEVNLKIMIAAIVVLFSVILFILGLHLYAKWFWKNSQFGGAGRQPSLRFHDDDDPMLSNPAFGLDRAFLEALPTFVFHDTQDSDKAKIPDCCAVCISEFQDGEAGRLLPKCGHAFHSECIDMWLHCHTTCPLCRTPIISLPWEARAKAEPVALDFIFLDPSILEEAAAAAATAAAEAAGSPRPSEQNPSSSVASDSLKPQDAQWGQLVIHIPQLSDGSSSSSSSASSSIPKSRWRNLRRMLSRDRDRDRKIVPSSVQSSPPNDVDHSGNSLD